VSEIFRNQSVYKTKLLNVFRKAFGTDLVRPHERSNGNQGISGTAGAELERWIGSLKPNRIVGDGFLGFRFPASPPIVYVGYIGDGQ